MELIFDHRPLISIINSKMLDELWTPRIARLKEKLTPYLLNATPRSFNVYGLWAAWPLWKSGCPGKFDMVLVRSQYLSDRRLCDHETGIVGLKELWAVFSIKFEKNRSKRVSIPTPESKAGSFGRATSNTFKLLSVRKETPHGVVALRKRSLRRALCYWKPFVRSFAQVLSFHVPAVGRCCLLLKVATRAMVRKFKASRVPNLSKNEQT